MDVLGLQQSGFIKTLFEFQSNTWTLKLTPTYIEYINHLKKIALYTTVRTGLVYVGSWNNDGLMHFVVVSMCMKSEPVPSLNQP